MAPSERPLELVPPSEALMNVLVVGVLAWNRTCGSGVGAGIAFLPMNPAFSCHWELNLHCWVVEKVGSYWT